MYINVHIHILVCAYIYIRTRILLWHWSWVGFATDTPETLWGPKLSAQFLYMEDSSLQAERGKKSGTANNIIYLLQSLLFYYFKLCTGDRIHTRQKIVQLPVLSQISSCYKPHSPSSDNLVAQESTSSPDLPKYRTPQLRWIPCCHLYFLVLIIKSWQLLAAVRELLSPEWVRNFDLGEVSGAIYILPYIIHNLIQIKSEINPPFFLPVNQLFPSFPLHLHSLDAFNAIEYSQL